MRRRRRAARRRGRRACRLVEQVARLAARTRPSASRPRCAGTRSGSANVSKTTSPMLMGTVSSAVPCTSSIGLSGSPVVGSALERQRPAGHLDRGVDALVEAARVVGHAEHRHAAERVPADGDVLEVDVAGEGIVVAEGGELVDHEADVARLVLDVGGDVHAVAAQGERRQGDDVARRAQPSAYPRKNRPTPLNPWANTTSGNSPSAGGASSTGRAAERAGRGGLGPGLALGGVDDLDLDRAVGLRRRHPRHLVGGPAGVDQRERAGARWRTAPWRSAASAGAAAASPERAALAGVRGVVAGRAGAGHEQRARHAGEGAPHGRRARSTTARQSAIRETCTTVHDAHPPITAVREAVARALAEDLTPLGDLTVRPAAARPRGDRPVRPAARRRAGRPPVRRRGVPPGRRLADRVLVGRRRRPARRPGWRSAG